MGITWRVISREWVGGQWGEKVQGIEALTVDTK